MSVEEQVMKDMSEEDWNELMGALRGVAKGLRAIAGGDGQSGPSGLEGVAMAIAGEGLRNDLAGAIGAGFDRLADSVESGLGQIAEAIEKS